MLKTESLIVSKKTKRVVITQKVLVKCDRCGKDYLIIYYNYIKGKEKSKADYCLGCKTSMRQQGKTIEEQWGKETANKAKEKLSLYMRNKEIPLAKGIKWTEEQKENLRKVRPTNRTLEERYGEERAKEVRYKMSIHSTKPNKGKPSPTGSGNGWSGWYKGWYFRSLLELSYMINTIEKENLEWRTTETTEWGIPYIDYKGSNRTYFPDFLINGKTVVEIKPKKLHESDSVRRKKEAAIKWCQERGLEYDLIDPNTSAYLSLQEVIQLHDSGVILFLPRYEKKYIDYIKEKGLI